MIRIAPIDTTSRPFTQAEVNELIPVLHRVTGDAMDRVRALTGRYGELSDIDPEQAVLEHQISGIIQIWGRKVMKLGARPTGIWEVEFETGDDFPRKWKYPDE